MFYSNALYEWVCTYNVMTFTGFAQIWQYGCMLALYGPTVHVATLAALFSGYSVLALLFSVQYCKAGNHNSLDDRGHGYKSSYPMTGFLNNLFPA